MRVEHITDGSPDSSLILFYGGQPQEALKLFLAMRALAVGYQAEFAIHELPGFESVDGCQVFAVSVTKDLGIAPIDRPNAFEWALHPDTWAQVAGLVSPFCRDPQPQGLSFQYLDESGDIPIIISTGRNW